MVPLISNIAAAGCKSKSGFKSRDGWLVFILLAWMATGLSTAPLAAREVTITLLHTTDIHGHVAPVMSGRDAEPGGGLLRCASRIREIRGSDTNVILVDVGDLLAGSAESFITQGGVVTEAVRQLRYDALVTGNHEFDGGVVALRRFYENCGVPVLAANIRAPREPVFCGARPFLCKDVDGVRVGIVGLSNPLIPMWSRPRLLGDVTVESSLTALRRVMPLVREQKPDILVLAVHQGWRERDDPANEIRAITKAFPEFDVILGAHSHQAVEWKTVNGIAYTQAGSYGLWLGVVRMVYDANTRRIKSKQIELLPVDSTVLPDKALENSTAASLRKAAQYLNREVGVAAVELKPTSRVAGQSAIQTLIAAAIAERVQADVVFHGTLSEESLRAGRVTMRDVWRIVPYDNYIGVAYLTLDELREILEENGGFFKSRNFRGVYGLTYDLTPGAESGRRVRNVRLTGDRKDGPEKTDDGRRTTEDGSEKMADRRVRVAFNSYDMASAGGRLNRLRAIIDQPGSRLEECPDADTREAVRAYLLKHQPLDIQAAPGVSVVRKPK